MDDESRLWSVSELGDETTGCRMFRRIAALYGWKTICFFFSSRHIGIFTVLCGDAPGKMDNIWKWFSYGAGSFSVKNALGIVVKELVSGRDDFGVVYTRYLDDLVSDSLSDLDLKLTLRGV